MIEIGMNNIVKNFGFGEILSGLDLEIATGDRVAVVGPNGSGKTTLFRLITGEETPNSGAVSVRKGASVGYLEQIPVITDAAGTARDMLMPPFAEVLALEERLRDAEAGLSSETDPVRLERLMESYGRLQDRFTEAGGYQIEETLGRVTGGFGIADLLDRPFRLLSGGQKTLVKLAATLLKNPDILLLDEPTNHLDIEAMAWFEGFIAKYKGTVVVISHDRYFLDRAVTKTVMLEGGRCRVYNGNYTASLKERENELLVEFAQYKNQQKKIEAIKAAIRRYRDWARQADNEALYRKAKELEKRLEKMDILERPQMEARKIALRFSGDRTGRDVLTVKGFTLGYDGLPLLEGVSFIVYEKEKVCLMGGNGTGKTSLLRAVLGEEPRYSGEIVLNPSARVGFIPQEVRFPDDKDSVLAAFRREYVCSEGEARNILAKYFFYGDNIFKRVGALSGGEKVLLKLAALVQGEINFLIMDEPTNHIDIHFREMLEEALKDYGGTLLFVSHDRYFTNVIAGRILTIANRKIDSFPGTYDELVAARDKAR